MDTRRCFIATTLGAALLAGCATANPRIDAHRAEFARLDPTTQQAIERGEVAPGYTTDMVYMALGRPAHVTTDAARQEIWTYQYEPVTAYNETIQDRFRKRVVYDPVKRTDDVIVEPIDTKAFPNLVPHTLRLTFHAGRLARIERLER